MTLHKNKAFGLISQFGLLLLPLIVLTPNARAQISSDGTLSTTVTTPNNQNFIINNGDRAGTNLFHSFSQFSLPTNGSAFFNNATDITNIFSRITGGNISNIDGLIKANGNANLFLLNPSGILFGPNARLDIGGSFIGTTANSVQFADGIAFSATNPNASPILSMSVPIGLQFALNPSPIQVQGTGHNLTLDTTTTGFPPFTREPNPAALTVQPGKTLALVGGNVSLDGGQLVAEGGRIEVGSVGFGRVGLTPTASGFALNYGGAPVFRDIQLSQKALIDASGSDSTGGIHIAGRQVRVLDGSIGLIQNIGTSEGGKIAVNATDLVEFTGTSADGQFRANLTTETTTDRPSGDIEVSARDLIFREGGQLVTRTFTAGNAGKMSINTSQSVQVLGISPINFRFPSNIFATTSGRATGSAGDVDIATKRLVVADGAVISNASFSNGTGGTLRINAESVEISGVDSVFQTPSDLRVGSFRGGDGGRLLLNTQRLIVRDGGRINGWTIDRGNAGTIDINASQFIALDGGTITASGTVPDPRVIVVGGVDPELTGQAGRIGINTPILSVRNGGEVLAQNVGTGDGGDIRVNAGAVLLDNEGIIAATAQEGDAGTIQVNAQTGIVLSRDSLISVEASDSANAGSIALSAPVVAGFGNSDVVATAVRGRGGNVAIATQALLGLRVRNQRTPGNDIVVESQLGPDGTVQIGNFSSFNLQAVKFLTEMNDSTPVNLGTTTASHSAEPDTPVEAGGWRVNANGNVELLATP
ncbi:MAG: filamentous hemagglutinin N-terminal domain-containing protein [Cyanobacteriota bacterium]|nr:filamentous hemagglutinin N-terminal domain-containing protein [Cyanobacteriota bacterium]